MSREKNILDKKILRNGLDMGLPLQTWVKKTVYGMETCRISGKEKVLGAAVSKDSHANRLEGYEMMHHYWFPWEKCN